MAGSFGVFVWIFAAAVMFVLEASTAQMVSIWFAVGALFAAIPAYFGASLGVQLFVFLVFSVLFLFAVRPLVKKRLQAHKQPTNADMVIGQTGIVLEEIDNARETGRVSAMGLNWSARSEDATIISADARVLVLRIEGVKLIVTPVK